MEKWQPQDLVIPCTTGHRALYRALAKDRFYERPVVAWQVFRRAAHGVPERRMHAMVVVRDGRLVRAIGLLGFLCVLDPQEYFRGLLGDKTIKTHRNAFDHEGGAAVRTLETLMPIRVRKVDPTRGGSR